MKKINKDCDKCLKRESEIKEYNKTDASSKVKHMDNKTRMLGTERKVYRNQCAHEGLPKWKKR
jgi:hypothetical protein